MNKDKKCNRILIVVSVILMVFSVGILRVFLPLSLLFDAEWKGTSLLYQFVLSDMWGWALSIALLIAVIAGIITGLLVRIVSRFHPALLLVSVWLLSTVAALFLCGGLLPPTQNNRIKTMMVLSGREDWQGIVDYARKYPCASYLEFNILNQALAETGRLSASFRNQKQRNVRHLFVLEVEGPYVSAILSDVYWSMGEISMSQMYAFEANEKVGNYSPRLLKRLVQTNLVYGYYAVASKYLDILSKYTMNEDFVAYYRRLLSDEAVDADPVLGMKRRCIPQENGFPSSRSIPYDLQTIIKQCPEHRASAQYLEAVLLL